MTVSEARRWQDSPDATVRAEARRVLAARASRSRRTAGKKAPGREAKKATKTERRNATSALRAKVWVRCGGKVRVVTDESGADETLYEGVGHCEFCRAPVGPVGWELHHILSGGARRIEEREDTVAAVCRYCHRQYHAYDVSTLRNAKGWALVYGFKDALRAIEKRLAKVQEARRRPSVPVRVEVRG